MDWLLTIHTTYFHSTWLGMVFNLIGCLWTIFPCQRVIRSQDMGAAIIFADCRIVYEATNNPSGLIYRTWQSFTLAPCLREQNLTSCLSLCLNIPMTQLIFLPLIISKLTMHHLLPCKRCHWKSLKMVFASSARKIAWIDWNWIWQNNDFAKCWNKFQIDEQLIDKGSRSSFP